MPVYHTWVVFYCSSLQQSCGPLIPYCFFLFSQCLGKHQPALLFELLTLVEDLTWLLETFCSLSLDYPNLSSVVEGPFLWPMKLCVWIYNVFLKLLRLFAYPSIVHNSPVLVVWHYLLLNRVNKFGELELGFLQDRRWGNGQLDRLSELPLIIVRP